MSGHKIFIGPILILFSHSQDSGAASWIGICWDVKHRNRQEEGRDEESLKLSFQQLETESKQKCILKVW